MYMYVGSERVKKSFSAGSTFKEATEINSSLLVLSRVLRAKITPGNTHVPYRDSALTMALEDMFESHNHRAVLFACISPYRQSVAESDQTLRFACNATYVQEPSTSSSSAHKGISVVQQDTKENSDWSQLRRAAEATKGLFGGFGDCMLPAIEGFPRLHCIGRDASSDCDCGSDGGDEGNGAVETETVVLLHYYGGACFEKGAAMWSEAIQKFPPHLRVIALSFSGHGLSEGRPPRSSPEAEWFLEPGGAVAQVQRMMDYFGVKQAHLVGFDYGGGVAMQMTLSVPRRVLSLCAWNPSYRISPCPCQEASSPSLSLSLNKKKKQKQQKQEWMVQRISLIVTSSVWMPEKKISSLQNFMNTKVSKCRRESDVWKKIFKFLLQ